MKDYLQTTQSGCRTSNISFFLPPATDLHPAHKLDPWTTSAALLRNAHKLGRMGLAGKNSVNDGVFVEGSLIS